VQHNKRGIESLLDKLKTNIQTDVEAYGLLGKHRETFPEVPKASEMFQGLEVTHVAYDEAHILDAIAYGTATGRMTGSNFGQSIPRPKTLKDYSNADLVMEMLERGFAVVKTPAPGQFPEVLK
jgi:hypothetical protein